MEHKYGRRAVMFLDGDKRWYMQAYEITCNGAVIGGMTTEGHVGKGDAKTTWHIGDVDYETAADFMAAHEAEHE